MALVGAVLAPGAQAELPDFEDVTSERLSGNTNILHDDMDEKDLIVVDIDRDGDSDVVVVRKLPFSVPGPRENVLLMNESNVLVERTSTLAPDLSFPDDARDVQAIDVDGDEWLDIVVVNTSAGERYGKDDYIMKGCGIGREATLWMLEQGVRVTGTDAWSWDAPFALTAKRWMEEKDPSIIWEGHRASMEIGYCHMEKLANLDQLPDHGFEISCFPWKIKNASAGFTRAVAILEE